MKENLGLQRHILIHIQDEDTDQLILNMPGKNLGTFIEVIETSP